MHVHEGPSHHCEHICKPAITGFFRKKKKKVGYFLDRPRMISYFWKWREWWYEVTDKQQELNFNITNAQTDYKIYVMSATVH
jgi:hypothetical protein